MKTLVDANVLLDVITRDAAWSSWSEAAPRGEHSTLAINAIIFAEVSMKFARIEDADAALVDFAREPLPYEAAFLTGKVFLAYKKLGDPRHDHVRHEDDLNGCGDRQPDERMHVAEDEAPTW